MVMLFYVDVFGFAGLVARRGWPFSSFPFVFGCRLAWPFGFAPCGSLVRPFGFAGLGPLARLVVSFFSFCFSFVFRDLIAPGYLA